MTEVPLKQSTLQRANDSVRQLEKSKQKKLLAQLQVSEDSLKSQVRLGRSACTAWLCCCTLLFSDCNVCHDASSAIVHQMCVLPKFNGMLSPSHCLYTEDSNALFTGFQRLPSKRQKRMSSD